MQIMPQTWSGLRLRYGLGANPYDPHDNILAGAAYLRSCTTVTAHPVSLPPTMPVQCAMTIISRQADRCPPRRGLTQLS